MASRNEDCWLYKLYNDMVLTIKANKNRTTMEQHQFTTDTFWGSQLIFFAGCLLGSLTATKTLGHDAHPKSWRRFIIVTHSIYPTLVIS